MQSQNFNHVTSCPYLPGTLGKWKEGSRLSNNSITNGIFFFFFFSGQHLKKSSLSESSSDIMDLDDGVCSIPGLLDQTCRQPPFFGVHCSFEKQQHNSALVVSIETDVWQPGE